VRIGLSSLVKGGGFKKKKERKKRQKKVGFYAPGEDLG